ncbi:hypothetical protein K461DRAFT_219272 [Myriangium duriaei CBS 260.36]|uniref:Cryptic loci regulator 2 N-terminal domain-containing protein n=1 Tax=Myriangium duriaei CBS 260.36 TaxID=1168546 RepID=A0A9P4JBV4_9PEZI|nr:hypothetical protein K461DRAFT_219272 [Myriangium duriaei CBS 260.36]
MGRFFPLYIRRSDGKTDIKNRHKLVERNEPTPEQLNRTADANGIADFYREVDLEEQKHLDWRRKLGGMLARDLGFSDPEKGYILVSFPEHYRLYEHVKRAEDESKAKTVKNHAGGGNERQDAYLYGHPMGRKKRYRSPADFYPHLYWLATDEQGDPDNCCCKICCPEEIDDKAAAQQAKKEVKQEPRPEIKQEANQAQKRAPLNTVDTLPQKQSQPAIATQQIKSPPPVSTQTMSQVKQVPPVIMNEDQRSDLNPGGFMFRQGELVWFNRGTAWGLGVISQRWQQSVNFGYTVQPLSHPYSHPQPVSVTGDQSLRPWLAWSVPNFTFPGLNNVAVTYETADWNAISHGQFGQGDLEVDGSILAAKAIDLSYTPFSKVSSKSTPDSTESSYNGVYLGAERVWRGDVVRLKSGSGLDIMVVFNITERENAYLQQVVSTNLWLEGEVYTMRQQPASSPPPDLSQLPARLIQDLTRRNSTTLAQRGFAVTYTRTNPTSLTTVDIKKIKGRWYEATLLGPVLLGQQQADQELKRGDLGEMGTRMNSRLDCHKNDDIPQTRRTDRREALGAAVPSTFRIVDAATGQQTQNPGQVQQFNGAQYASAGTGTLDEFMNLDG